MPLELRVELSKKRSARHWFVRVVYGTETKGDSIFKHKTVIRWGSRIFFRTGCTLLLLYFNINKPYSSFFCRIAVVLENRRSSQGEGGGGAHPLNPPPRSAPDNYNNESFSCNIKSEGNQN